MSKKVYAVLWINGGEPTWCLCHKRDPGEYGDLVPKGIVPDVTVWSACDTTAYMGPVGDEAIALDLSLVERSFVEFHNAG